jgi:hypothetical protein
MRAFLREVVDVLVVERLAAAAGQLRFRLPHGVRRGQVDLHGGRGSAISPKGCRGAAVRFGRRSNRWGLSFPRTGRPAGQQNAHQMHNSSNMAETRYRGRRATSIENEMVRVTVLHEGGHIAEILDKRAASIRCGRLPGIRSSLPLTIRGSTRSMAPTPRANC